MARRRSGKKIDFVHWSGQAGSFLGQGAGTNALTLFAALHEPETLLRIRGNLITTLDGTQAPGGLVRMGLGIINVAEGTGTVANWSPLADPDAPWIWYDTFFVGYEEAVTDVIDVPGLSSYRSTIDSKAMRIIRNQELQLVLEQATTGAAMTTNTAVSVRILSGQ